MTGADVIPPSPTSANPYEAAAATLLRESGCTIRRYRSKNTGIAYTKDDDWGIIVPEPRGPVSFGVFAHEVGHQMLHRHNSAPRWREELEAWEYALAQFGRLGLDGVERSKEDAAPSLVYAAMKALRRRCAPATAQAILDAFPDWVWEHDERSRDEIALYAGAVPA